MRVIFAARANSSLRGHPQVTCRAGRAFGAKVPNLQRKGEGLGKQRGYLASQDFERTSKRRERVLHAPSKLHALPAGHLGDNGLQRGLHCLQNRRGTHVLLQSTWACTTAKASPQAACHGLLQGKRNTVRAASASLTSMSGYRSDSRRHTRSLHAEHTLLAVQQQGC